MKFETVYNAMMKNAASSDKEESRAVKGMIDSSKTRETLGDKLYNERMAKNPPRNGSILYGVGSDGKWRGLKFKGSKVDSVLRSSQRKVEKELDKSTSPSKKK